MKNYFLSILKKVKEMFPGNLILRKFPDILYDKDFSELIKGSSFSFLFRVIGVVCKYVFTFLVTAFYGASGFGLYSLSLTILGIFAMFGSFGFQTSILRFVSQYSLDNDFGKIGAVYITALKIVIPISFFLSVILFFGADYASAIVFKDVSLIIPLKVFSFIIPITVLNNINIEAIRGLKNIKYSEYLRCLNLPVANVLFFILLELIFTTRYLPEFSFAIATITSFSLSMFYIWKLLKPLRIMKFKEIRARDLFKISHPMFVTAFSFLIMGNIDTLMLGMLSTTEKVGIYGVALRVAFATNFIIASVNIIAAPKFSELFWAKKTNDLKKVVNYVTRLIFWFTLPLIILFAVFPGFFMGLFGKAFLPGKNALLILTLGQFICSIAGSVGYFLDMTGRQHIFRNIIMIGAGINILLNYLLIPKYGMSGAAVASMISTLFWCATSACYVKLKDDINAYYVPFININ